LVFYRRCLHKVSREEQAGTAGGAEARQQLVGHIRAEDRRALALVEATEQVAADLYRAARALKHPRETPCRGPFSRKARAAALLGISSPALADRLTEAAERASRAAERASDRLQAHTDERAATRLHAQLVERLPEHNFNISAPPLKALRVAYQMHVEAARKARHDA
jgi:hypothetical protein